MPNIPPDHNVQITEQFSFEQLAKIAQDDPAQFEKIREEIIQSEIERISNGVEEKKNQMERIQFRVDMACRKVKSPLVRCEIVTKMMYEKFFHLNDLLQNFSGANPSSRTSSTEQSHSKASILSFDKRRENHEQRISNNQKEEKE